MPHSPYELLELNFTRQFQCFALEGRAEPFQERLNYHSLLRCITEESGMSNDIQFRVLIECEFTASLKVLQIDVLSPLTREQLGAQATTQASCTPSCQYVLPLTWSHHTPKSEKLVGTYSLIIAIYLFADCQQRGHKCC